MKRINMLHNSSKENTERQVSLSKMERANVSEMKKFFALVMAMGLLTQMDVSEYWTVNPVTATPFFPSVTLRDRFLLLLTFIHLNENKEYILRGTEGHDPLF